MVKQTDSGAVKFEFRGKTRTLVCNHANATFSGSELAKQVLNRENTNVVFKSLEEVNEFQRMLEQIEDNPEYNGHMDSYVTKVNRKLEATKGWF